LSGVIGLLVLLAANGMFYFWPNRVAELELADGRKCSSLLTPAVYTQPPGWKYAEGNGVPEGQDIKVGISFKP